MTVHGAKGLEAPVVILADATNDPLKSGGPKKSFDKEIADSDARLPMLHVPKAIRSGPLADDYDDAQTRDLREHYRLLYVALTRASEHLVIAGSLGKRGKETPEHSWYNACHRAMGNLGCQVDTNQILRFAGSGEVLQNKSGSEPLQPRWSGSLPGWLLASAPVESIPPRPLAPSNLDDDSYGEAPATDATRLAALRGKLMHGLFEQYDGRDAKQFETDALAWLERNDGGAGLDHQKMVAQAMAVLGNPDWTALFSSAARAEVPLAAVVGTTVISGRVDRLLVEAELVRFVDFKTGRRVPKGENEVPAPILRQMAHYAAALEAIFPGRKVEASLLYTSGPVSIRLSTELLEPYKPS
jgi:ATP-dependent helicase/nuclease subunit A